MIPCDGLSWTTPFPPPSLACFLPSHSICDSLPSSSVSPLPHNPPCSLLSWFFFFFLDSPCLSDCGAIGVQLWGNIHCPCVGVGWGRSVCHGTQEAPGPFLPLSLSIFWEATSGWGSRGHTLDLLGHRRREGSFPGQIPKGLEKVCLAQENPRLFCGRPGREGRRI